MSVRSTARGRRISLGPLHLGQLKAYWSLQPRRFKALRCGRRFGKTEFAKTWIAQGLVQGEPSRRRSSTSDIHEITCSTKSRVFALAIEEATARTTFSTPSATASRLLSEITKASDRTLWE